MGHTTSWMVMIVGPTIDGYGGHCDKPRIVQAYKNHRVGTFLKPLEHVCVSFIDICLAIINEVWEVSAAD